MSLASAIVEIIGIAIFVYSFIPQVLKIYKGKETIGMSPLSWFINYVGRYLWIWLSAFTLSGYLAIVMMIGQGIVALLNIPIVYYSLRNYKLKGTYQKESFNWPLFIFRVSLIVITIASLVIGLAIKFGEIPINMDPSKGTLDSSLDNKLPQIPSLIFGTFVGFLTGVAFLPQVIKVMRTKNTKSISLTSSLMFGFGNGIIILGLILNMTISLDKFVSTIGAVTLATCSTIMLFYNAFIKWTNMRKYGEL